MLGPIKKIPHRKTKTNKTLRILICVLGVLLLVLMYSIYFMKGDCSENIKSKTTNKTIEKQSKKAPKAIKKYKAAQTNNTSKAKKTKVEFEKRPGAMQLPDGRVLTFKPPKEGEFRIIHSHGLMYKCDHLGNWEDVTPKPVFDNAFEETLLGLATRGDFIPGMLMGIDHKQAIKMLTKPVVINEGYSEEIIAKKEAVAAAKEAILEYMKEGASLDDFVMEMRKQIAKERNIRGTVLKEIIQSLKEGRTQDAADMRNAANIMLERDSLPSIKLPPHIENAIEESK
jgi:hypothetical protein